MNNMEIVPLGLRGADGRCGSRPHPIGTWNQQIRILLVRVACVAILSLVSIVICAPTAAAELRPERESRSSVGRALQTIERGIPSSGDHPGNVLLLGEEVSVKVPADVRGKVVQWRVLDDRSDVITSGTFTKTEANGGTRIIAGDLGIGWYRVEFLDAEGKPLQWTSAAVLARLSSPVPQDSPICVDSATAWFARDDAVNQERLARLAALAGVNWVRDRMRWRDVHIGPNEFAIRNTYDMAAEIQTRVGLKVLQVFHDTPPWAGTLGRKHLPADLRVLYRFCRAMAERYKGRVRAWEPWNEANVEDFGGHTVDEMCVHQKAAFLGFKAGDPNLIVCWNAYTGAPTRLHTTGVLKNETWPYFDTYNIHTYDWPHSYFDLWEPAREAACGRPIWVTESDRGMKYETGPPWYDLSRTGERLKAQFIAQSYASSLFAGANRHFHFILGHYTESRNHVQFGLLRRDHTPRPGYVALAAVGRFLAGARCVGRWPIKDRPEAHIYAFRARPDGRERDVLVAWAETKGEWSERGNTSVDWVLPKEISADGAFDYLGRPLGKSIPAKLRSSAIFVLLPPGETRKLAMEAPPPVSQFRDGTPSPVVLQIQMPRSAIGRIEGQRWSQGYEYRVEPGKEIDLQIYAYNFCDGPVSGTVAAEHLPSEWTLVPDRWEITLEPSGRKPLPARVVILVHEGDAPPDDWIQLRGEFGRAGRPVLAFRLAARK